MKPYPQIDAKRSGGFTMMELLIAITILTIIVGIVYASFASVTGTLGMARDQATLLRARQYLWRQISTDLSAVYTDPAMLSPQYEFVGTSEDGAFGPMDTLTFCTSLPMSGGQALPGVLKVVSYAVVDSYAEEDMGGYRFEADENSYGGVKMALEITETPLTPQPKDDFTADAGLTQVQEEAFVKRIPIGSFDVAYFDPEKEDWVDQWDSTTEQLLPWAVRVRANFARTPEEMDDLYEAGIDPRESPDMELHVVLPTAAGVITPEPFMDPNHLGDLEMLSEMDGFMGLGADTE